MPQQNQVVLYLLRHADCAPGSDNQARPLNDRGLAQASARAVTLRGVTFTRAFASSAQRTIETRDIILDDKHVHRRALEELYRLPDEDGRVFAEGYARLKDASFAAYLEALGPEIFERYAARVFEQVGELPRGTYLFVGHHMLLNALALAFISGCAYGLEARKLILETNPGETEGFKITLSRFELVIYAKVEYIR
jgi:phosphohistidine phosphatase SixA